jgi:crotonobetainyl-CoA:carnitine CoA-transferase CaiB-like acyl-CoA transferase
MVWPGVTRLLDGLTVLDFTRVLAGPYCTRLFADLGARVLKIERPGEGDEMRRGFLQLEDGRTDQATYFIRINAGKQSLALDLAHPLAGEVIRDLTRLSDVVVENFVPGVVARLGCDYATLSAIKPDLGVMHLEQQGDPVPRVNYLQTADVLAGTQAFGAILAALWRRARTGRGAYLDVAMLECLVASEDVTYGSVLNGGQEYLGPRPGMVIHAIDGRSFAMQTVGAPQLWPRLLETMKRPELGKDPRFATPLARREHWPELRSIIVAWLDTFPSADAAIAGLSAARLPAAPVLSPREVTDHPHLAEREFFPSVPHPARGRVGVTAIPFQVDGARPTPAAGAPYRVGEDTRSVLTGILGYDDARVESLRKAGAIEVV